MVGQPSSSANSWKLLGPGNPHTPNRFAKLLLLLPVLPAAAAAGAMETLYL
jgi:hypothetical protein